MDCTSRLKTGQAELAGGSTASRDLENDLAGDLVGGADGVGTNLHLVRVVVAADLRPRHAGDLDREREQAHELVDFLLLTVERFGAHQTVSLRAVGPRLPPSIPAGHRSLKNPAAG